MPSPRAPEPAPVERVGRVREGGVPPLRGPEWGARDPKADQLRRLVRTATPEELGFLLNLVAGEVRRRAGR
jgi:hypothetical protein